MILAAVPGAARPKPRTWVTKPGSCFLLLLLLCCLLQHALHAPPAGLCAGAAVLQEVLSMAGPALSVFWVLAAAAAAAAALQEPALKAAAAPPARRRTQSGGPLWQTEAWQQPR